METGIDVQLEKTPAVTCRGRRRVHAVVCGDTPRVTRGESAWDCCDAETPLHVTAIRCCSSVVGDLWPGGAVGVQVHSYSACFFAACYVLCINN